MSVFFNISLDLFFSREFWNSNLTSLQMVCYLTGMFYYLVTGISVVFMFVPSIYLLIYKPEYVHWFNLIWSIPSLLLINVYMRYWQKTRFTWAAIQCRQVSYYSHLFALWDTLWDTAEAWVPTGGAVKSKRYPLFKLMCRTHITAVAVSLLGLSVYRITLGAPIVNFIPLLLLLAYQVASVLSAIK